jgi:hypothetical protein
LDGLVRSSERSFLPSFLQEVQQIPARNLLAKEKAGTTFFASKNFRVGYARVAYRYVQYGRQEEATSYHGIF